MQVKLVVIAGLLAVPLLGAPKRHAVIVGISKYAAGPCRVRNQSNERGFVLDAAVIRGRQYWCPEERTPNLENALNDANAFRQLLQQRYGFQDSEITFLADGKATARAILSAIDSMIQTLNAGDTAVFYFAGHGTQIRNSTPEAQGKFQEALVPHDFLNGTYPIMDFELSRRYRNAVAKKIQMNAILDSCFSGGGARGQRFRTMTDVRTVKFERQLDRSGTFALLAASRPEQPATDSPETFTQALVKVIQIAPQELSLTELARLAEIRLNNRQNPLADGDAKEHVNVIGMPIDRRPNIFLVKEAQTLTGRIVIDGGSARGLTVGSTLTSKDSPNNTAFVVAEVQPTMAILKSSVKQILPRQGDLLTLVRWQPPSYEAATSVYLPANLPSQADIIDLRSCLNSISPGVFAPEEAAFRIEWADQRWHIVSKDGLSRPFRCSEFRQSPNQSVVAIIPLTREIANTLRRDLGAFGEMLQDRSDALFEIVGRLREGHLEYSLVRRFGEGQGVLTRATDWNRDWQVNGIEADDYTQSSPDCLVDVEFCSSILNRRIQRSRIAMDLVHLQIESQVQLSSAGHRGPPFEVQLRERNGTSCSNQAVYEIIKGREYCLFLVRLSGDTWVPGRRWYVSLFTIDGAGLNSGFLANLDGTAEFPESDSATSQEFLVMPDRLDPARGAFVSKPTEGDTETLFVYISNSGRESQLDMPAFTYFQQPVELNRGAAPPQKKGLIAIQETNSRGESTSWSISVKTIRVKDN